MTSGRSPLPISDSHGAKLWENFDWSHPFGFYFTPRDRSPRVTTSTTSASTTTGSTTPYGAMAKGTRPDLHFGVSAEDAMWIATGQYYQ